MAEMMALSPDGQHVAYTTRNGSDLSIVMMAIDDPKSKWTLRVEDSPPPAPAPPPAPGSVSAPVATAATTANQPPVQLRFLRWGPAGRLVFAPIERIVPLPPITDKDGRARPNPDGPTILSPIMVVDVATKARGTLVDANAFQETPESARRTLADLLRTTKELVTTSDAPVHWKMPHLDILGFSARGRDQLIIQTRGAYSAPAKRAIDIRTGQVALFEGNWNAPPGDPHIFDWDRLRVVGERGHGARPTTVWSDPELAGIQRELAIKFPRRAVEIADWNDTRARVLFHVTGGSDPGRVFVWQRPEDLVLEIFSQAPWLTAARLNETRFFECDAPDGAYLSGYVTWPKAATSEPPPLLLCLPNGFPGHAQPAFDPEAQIFADWGFVVVRLNHRGVAGVRTADLETLRAAIDRVSVDDALTVIDGIAKRHPDRPFDRRRVATFGRGFGGYLALRALQLHPTAFRCGVAIDAPMTLRPWLYPTAAAGTTAVSGDRGIPAELLPERDVDWTKLSVSASFSTLVQPVYLLAQPGRNSAVDASAAELRTALGKLGRAPGYLELGAGFNAGQPESRIAVYRELQSFLGRHVQLPAAETTPTKEGN